MLRTLVFVALAALSSCAQARAPMAGAPHSDSNAAQEAAAQATPETRPHLATVREALWPRTTIPVCWEEFDHSTAADRALVQRATAESWQASSAIRFVGWSECAPRSDGIRIRVEDSGPHTKGLGNRLDSVPAGMVLNFTFQNWSQSCRSMRERCIYSITVHEFGHALGFTHEQNRPDAPGECATRAQGTDPNTLLTPYDPQSVMNYCNPLYNNDGRLSASDVTGVQAVYR